VDALTIDWFEDAGALPGAWDRRVEGAGPTLQRDYLEAFDAARPAGVDPRFALVRRGDAVVAAAAFQLVSLDVPRLGTLVREGPALVRLFLSVLELVRRRPPRLLLCGNALHSDAPGFVVAAQEPDPAALLHAVVEDLRRRVRGGVDAIVLKDPDLPGGGGALAGLGYHAFSRSQPTMRVPLDPSWTGWDDYLDALRKKYRQRARAARKKGAGLTREVLDADGVATHADTLDALLAPVMDGADLVVKRFPIATLVALKRGLGERVRVVLYRHDGAPVGFSASLRTGRQLDGLLVGMGGEGTQDVCLYQNVLYDFIEDGISHGCTALELGRTALEIKSTVGAQPAGFDVYVRHANSLLHAALGAVLARVPAVDWEPRHAFTGVPVG
jgi:hypothetical protein